MTNRKTRGVERMNPTSRSIFITAVHMRVMSNNSSKFPSDENAPESICVDSAMSGAWMAHAAMRNTKRGRKRGKWLAGSPPAYS